MYPDETSNSAKLFQRAVKVMPGGNSRHTVYFPPYPVYAARAEGAKVWDVDGVERLDLINNYSSLIHGHNHPRIVEAIVKQAHRVLSISLPTEEEVRLAEMITARVPGVELIRFGNSGSEGVLLAIKAARAYTGKAKIAKVEGAYHGSGESASVSASPSPALWGDPDEPATVSPSSAGPGVGQDIVVLPMNRVEASRKILRKHAADLAGVIIDPLVNALGYKAATPEFVQMIREETEACGALLLFDEVYSFRLGYHGAQGVLGITPDLTALGKIIGGGLPVGAVGGKREIMEAVFDPRAGAPKMSHGGTFNANPMTMAAGAVAMELFDQASFERLGALGDRLRKGLREALNITRSPGTVGGAASMISLFHAEAEIETYRDVVNSMRGNAEAQSRAAQFFRFMLNNGVLMGAPGFIVLSTALTDGDIDFVLEKAVQGLREMN
ncbi:MAG TPA: aspartate aminotransferase family protein [Rhizomicrobium sp.]|jgi:glutamate-1-semialdehyde 2,1-aminomutase